MKIFKDLAKIEDVSVGLGFFDGVHKGHKTLINELVSTTKSEGAKSLVVTFKKSPAEKFYNNVVYLNTLREKEELISELGVDYLVELDFDEKLMNMGAEEYLNKVLYSNFRPKYIFTGFNHTFGNGKEGNSDFLKKNQKKYAYIYKEIAPCMYDGAVISSTLIRECLEKGDTEKANILLGYEYNISGVVIKGNQLGRTIGYPTANIEYPDEKVKIPYGVYSSEVLVSGKKYMGILNYGQKPTVNNTKSKPVAEVHILGFNSDIYVRLNSVLLKN